MSRIDQIIIAPSMLSCSFLNLTEEVKVFESISNTWIHLDIMDGHFVPNLTFGHDITKEIATIATKPLDGHFMVSNPEFYIDNFSDVGLHNFTFHYEAVDDCALLIKKAKKVYSSVGISIKPNTEVTKLSDEILSLVDLVLVMSVEPGFCGQKFMENSYKKISKLAQKKDKLKFSIQVDGGISDINANKLINAGADNLVSGSYIFKGERSTYIDKVESLRMT